MTVNSLCGTIVEVDGVLHYAILLLHEKDKPHFHAPLVAVCQSLEVQRDGWPSTLSGSELKMQRYRRTIYNFPSCLDRPEVPHSLEVLLLFQRASHHNPQRHQRHVSSGPPPPCCGLCAMTWGAKTPQMSLNGRGHHFLSMLHYLCLTEAHRGPQWARGQYPFLSGAMFLTTDSLWTDYWPC